MRTSRTEVRHVASRVCGALLVAAASVGMVPSSVAERASGAQLFDARCASCHAGDDPAQTLTAPPLDALRQMSWAHVHFAVTRGSMRPHAEGLAREAVDELVAWVTGESGSAATDIPEPAYCADDAPPAFDAVLVGSWGLDARSTRFQDASRTAINAGNAGSLTLRWAYGVPRTAMMRSMPVVTGNTVFLATLRGELHALDKHTGCVRWVRDLGVPLRTPLHLGAHPDTDEPVLYVGDMGAGMNAVDGRTGERLWRTSLRLTPWSMLTGSPVQHGARLIVPVSSFEVSLARNDAHECCRSRGAVVALDAGSGELQWQTFMTPEPEPTFQSRVGVQQWGPSGASVWSTPTIDADRGVVYVGTGQNNSSPPTSMSDAIVALDLDTGAVRWSYQGTSGDAYNDACVARPPGANCPPEAGPDFDFGASVIIARTPEGRDLLLAGQKSGVVHALDPDRDGQLVWSRRLSQGTWLGGVHFGMALAGDRLLVPINDPEYPIPDYEARPGLYALSATDGSLLWEHRIKRGCALAPPGEIGGPWPDCSFFYGYSPAITAADGVVFASGTDGTVRAHAIDDGQVLWEARTARPFATVNGIAAHGGAIANPGVQLAGRMMFVQSGYALHGLMPGNALLAYGLPLEAPAGTHDPSEITEGTR
jgi:polyvinyl alcohol dehydrogenase (cytochrome)